MGLDMYLYKVTKINRAMKVLYEGQVFDNEALDDISGKYDVAIGGETSEKPICEAVKKVGTKIIARITAYRLADIIEKYRPDINCDNISDYEAVDEEEIVLFYVYMKGDKNPIVINITKEQFNALTKVIDSDAYIYEKEEVCYWRKANQIRQWFVNNLKEPVENCEDSTVTKDNLEKLIKDCKEVLKNKDKAKEIIPTSVGFFFGGTEYDEWYFEEIESTLKHAEELLNSIDWENEALFYTEWW